MLPNLIIAGVPRAGTTSLFTWLASHPDVVASSVKETYYFVDRGTHSFQANCNFLDHGLWGYERYFPERGHGSIVLESTPAYIYQETALEHLPDLESKPRFVFILRHPADQILSSFRYFTTNWNYVEERLGFAEFVSLARARSPRLSNNELLQNAFANIRYDEFIARWRDRAGGNRLLVYLFEDLKSRPGDVVRHVAAQVGLDPSFFDNYEFQRENYTYNVRNSALQSLNIRLRKHLPISPRSELWRRLRAIYRLINTNRAEEPLSPRDEEQYRALRSEFDACYAGLRASYGFGGASIIAAHTSSAVALAEP
jgi:hypothetical protein